MKPLSWVLPAAAALVPCCTVMVPALLLFGALTATWPAIAGAAAALAYAAVMAHELMGVAGGANAMSRLEGIAQMAALAKGGATPAPQRRPH